MSNDDQAGNAPAPERACAHAGCECIVLAPDTWCSGACADAQQGYASMPKGMCTCNHDACSDAAKIGSDAATHASEGEHANG